MPLTDAELIALRKQAADALDAEAVWLVDVDIDDRGRSKPSIATRDRDYFEVVSEQAAALRSLVELIRSRRA